MRDLKIFSTQKQTDRSVIAVIVFFQKKEKDISSLVQNHCTIHSLHTRFRLVNTVSRCKLYCMDCEKWGKRAPCSFL